MRKSILLHIRAVVLAAFLIPFVTAAESVDQADLPALPDPALLGVMGMASPENGQDPIWAREFLSGDWYGARDKLDKRGISVEISYTGEVFSNLRGGLNTSDATEYNGIVDLIIGIDTGQLGLWSGGNFYFLAQDHHGDGITDDHVGDLQALSNIDADNVTQISEYWYEHVFWNFPLRLKLGKQDANTDFAAADYGGDFINSSFGFPPNIPMPSYPDPALAATAFTEPCEWFAAGAGVYDGDANGGTSGFNTAFDGEGGSFSIIELSLLTGATRESGCKGTYRFGLWYHSARADEINAAPAAGTKSSNHGLYAILDQPLWHEEKGHEEGLGAFLQFSWAPDDRNELGLYYGGGLSYTGLLDDREEDVTGIGVASARLGDDFRDVSGGTHETAVEFFYRIQWTPWLALQPDLQYIVNPGGDGDNALAAGARFTVIF